MHYHSNRLKNKKLQILQFTISEQNTKRAIKTKNNNPTGSYCINIRHLKHLGQKVIIYLTHTDTTLACTITKYPTLIRIISTHWTLMKNISIPKASKNLQRGTSYRPIALLSPIAKTLEKITLPHITNKLQNHRHTNTDSALQIIKITITTGLKKKKNYSNRQVSNKPWQVSLTSPNLGMCR